MCFVFLVDKWFNKVLISSCRDAVLNLSWNVEIHGMLLYCFHFQLATLLKYVVVSNKQNIYVLQYKTWSPPSRMLYCSGNNFSSLGQLEQEKARLGLLSSALKLLLDVQRGSICRISSASSCLGKCLVCHPEPLAESSYLTQNKSLHWIWKVQITLNLPLNEYESVRLGSYWGQYLESRCY